MVLTRRAWSLAAVPAALLVAGVPLSVGAAEATGRSIDLDASVRETRERVEANLERFSVPGAALALVVDGEVVWTEGFGLADTASGRPVQSDTRFQAGSLSKSVLAWTVLQLAAEGSIDLDVPVETQIDGWSLPEAPYDTAGVTPRRLLAHTSGLPFAIEGTPRTPAQLRAGEVDPDVLTVVQQPGTGFIYSNPGYSVLALLVEAATGEGLAVVVSQRILVPLGMEDSTFDPRADELAGAATGYTADGQSVAPGWASPLGASGLHTTAADLGRFVAAMHDGQRTAGTGVLVDVDELLRPRAPTAGLPHRLLTDATAYGHFVEELGEARLVLNAGEEEGWISGFATVPATGDGIVILTNSRNGYPLLIEELRAWTDGTQLPAPRLVRTHNGLRAGTVTATMVLLAICVALLLPLARRQPRVAGSRPRARWPRRLAAVGAAALLAATWWGVLAPTLRAFLPTLTPWTGLAVTLTAAALLLRATAVGAQDRAPRTAG